MKINCFWVFCGVFPHGNNCITPPSTSALPLCLNPTLDPVPHTPTLEPPNFYPNSLDSHNRPPPPTPSPPYVRPGQFMSVQEVGKVVQSRLVRSG